jgi:hypothetical protein
MEQRKQTAVEWLISQVEDFYCLLPVDMIEQAKQMEEEQIRDAWTDGCIGELYELNAYFSSGKYYNATYGKE